MQHGRLERNYYGVQKGAAVLLAAAVEEATLPVLFDTIVEEAAVLLAAALLDVALDATLSTQESSVKSHSQPQEVSVQASSSAHARVVELSCE